MFGQAFEKEFLEQALRDAARQAQVNFQNRTSDRCRPPHWEPQRTMRDLNTMPAPHPRKPLPGVLLRIQGHADNHEALLIYWRGQFYEGEIDETLRPDVWWKIGMTEIERALILVPVWTPVPRHRIPTQFLTP